MLLQSRQGPSEWHYAVACCVSFTEEPDVGNLQVRFCEGH